ncbi:molybdopterin converting factor subunit 1 [Rossellomorea sp. LjRoot5]|uniref:molybdopterin converting factor subunit 1 n=1 Tax=Rossellomorea sp. LjRoot5 TaxID=3342331 RepID=UPI003ECFB60D
MIKILVFAGLREETGKSEIEIEADNLSISGLKQQLLETYNSLNLNGAMIAVNEEYATDDTMVKSGDVVAFIPPVSGG